MCRRQRRDHIGAGEQQGIHRCIEAQGALESILEWPEIGRRRKPQFERQRTKIAIGDPSAKGENSNKVKLEALPWHGLVATKQLEDHPVSFIVFRYDEARRVADDADITTQTFQDAEQ